VAILIVSEKPISYTLVSRTPKSKCANDLYDYDEPCQY